MKREVEKSLKRYLKRKMKVTLGLLVAFMITGNIGYAAVEIVKEGTKSNVVLFMPDDSTGIVVGGANKNTAGGRKETYSPNIKAEYIYNGSELVINAEYDLDGMYGRPDFSDTVKREKNLTGNLIIGGAGIEVNGEATLDLIVNNGQNIVINATEFMEDNGKETNGYIGNTAGIDLSSKGQLNINSNDLTINNNFKNSEATGILLHNGGSGDQEKNYNSKLTMELTGDLNINNFEKGIIVNSNCHIENGDKNGISANNLNIFFSKEGKGEVGIGIGPLNFIPGLSTDERLSTTIDIGIQKNVNLYNYKKGINIANEKSKIDLTANGDINIIVDNKFKGEEFSNEDLGNGEIGISLDVRKPLDKAEESFISGNNINIINYDEGITNYNSRLELIANKDIKILANKTGNIGINLKQTSYSKESYVNLTASDGNIQVSNYRVGIYGGGANTKDSNIVNLKSEKGIIKISEIKETGVLSDGKNSKVILDSNYNEIISEDTGIYSKGRNSIIDITSNQRNEIVTLDGENISGTNYISAKNTAIKSEDSGEVLLKGTNNQILSDNIGINSNASSVIIGKTDDEILEKDTLISAGNEAIKSENNGTVDINSSNIYISGNENKTGKVITSDINYLEENEPLKVYATVYGENGNINLTGDNITIHSINTSKGDISDDNIREEYSAVLARDNSNINIDGSANIISENGVALYATNYKDSGTKLNASNKSKITLSDKGNHQIYGDIIAGQDSEININGSGNKISSFSNLNEDIEVMAGNGGIVNINLINGELTGRIDDYQQAGEFGKGTFRNNKFYQDISSSGEVNLNLTDGNWNALGQSFVTKIYGDNVSINMSGDVGNSIHINSLEGNGNITMNMNSDAVDNKGVLTDMLYIHNVSDEAHYNINIANGANILTLDDGEHLRFATINGENKKNVDFSISEVSGMGVRNVGFEVGHEEYKNNSEDNENYNGGNKETELKPGDSYVDDNYGENSGDVGENYYIQKSGQTFDNEITKTIISMAKSNYQNIIYMDNLNKRLGDMTFANGYDGIWVRMRNDRVGEDEVYRLHNYMTQVGYDKAYSMKNGTEHRGIAFEYTRGEMEYKEFSGEGDTDKWIVSLYDTRLYNNGLYADYIVKGGRVSSDFDIYAETNANGTQEKVKVTGDYDNLFLSASAEFGKRFDFDDNYYFEPQLQLQYTYIDDTDYTTNQNTKVDYSDINSLIGRIGIRLGHDFYNENSKDNTIYLKVDINHEFLGEQDVEAEDLTGSIDRTYHNDKSWFDVGIGGAKNLTEDLNVYADIERQFGEAKDNSWQFNLGFRYSF